MHLLIANEFFRRIHSANELIIRQTNKALAANAIQIAVTMIYNDFY
jgi:hypothetical protein